MQGSVTNLQLANSSITIGGQTISLGGSQSTFSGITLTSPSITNPIIRTSSASTPSTSIRSIASQTSNLQEWQNTAGTSALAYVDVSGNIYSSGNISAGGAISATGNVTGLSLYTGNNSGSGSTSKIYLAGGDGNHYIYSSGSTGNTTVFGEWASWNWVNTQYSTTIMSLNSTGLGIGISPSAKLHAQTSGAGVQTVAIFDNGDSTGNTVTPDAVKIGFANNGAVKASINAGVYGYDYIALNTGSDTERMRINASGQVGIGTPVPNKTLTVLGDYNFGVQRSWNLGQPTNPSISGGTNWITFKINMAAIYYRGFVFDIHMNGGLDFGGHGLVTYFGKFMMNFTGTTNVFMHTIQEYSGSGLDGTGFLTYNTFTSSNDGTYLYVTLNYKETLSSTLGHRPFIHVITYDPQSYGDISSTGANSQINSVYAV